MKRLLAFAFAAAIGCGTTDGVVSLPSTKGAGWIDSTRFANADREPDQWLSAGRSPYAQYYSPLDLINTGNVDQLGFAWEYVAKSTRGRVQHGMQATAVVVDGVMYVSGPWSVVYALDAATGQQRWRFDPKVDGSYPRRSCCGVSSRGVQVWQGKVYLATLDGYLIALDAGTGRELWRVDTFVDRTADYTITGAPHIAGSVVVVGNSGADFGVRGYVSAYDVESGALAWRFFTVPASPEHPVEHPELELAAQTWDPNSAWEAGLGGTVWGGMTYDPALDLLYIGTGNSSPYPIWFRSPGGGDNLFLASIIAIRPGTGRMAWYYQTTPGEIWDYTVSSNLVLADLEWKGSVRKVLMTAPKNGFFYVLDRATGKLLSAEKYVRVNWASHVDTVTGRPVLTGEGWYKDEPKLVFPSSLGGHSWMPMSFSPKTELVYIPTIEGGMIFGSDSSFTFRSHHIYQGIKVGAPHGVSDRLTGGNPELLESREYLQAWDPRTGTARWKVPLTGQFNGGVLSTGGDLVVQGQVDGRLVVRRADDGAVLKEIDVGTAIMAAPMTYSLGGVQYVAVMAGFGGGLGARFAPGNAGYRFENYPRILSFKLGGSETPRPPARVELEIPEPPPLDASSRTVARGGELFGRYCAYCHGAGGGAISAYPDLTRLPAAVHQRFRDVVLGGALVTAGMASFADVLDPADVDAIQAYLISAQHEAYRVRR
ncbi:MAG: PQQ-dependent dehydrogenase, methanol/ethanol family [Gemmatimonadales bacterium]|nr:PQQ-dependent dehydrogenase, methanol/ethanol family [Gemmatimonadales bacterium]